MRQLSVSEQENEKEWYPPQKTHSALVRLFHFHWLVGFATRFYSVARSYVLSSRSFTQTHTQTRARARAHRHTQRVANSVLFLRFSFSLRPPVSLALSLSVHLSLSISEINQVCQGIACSSFRILIENDRDGFTIVHCCIKKKTNGHVLKLSRGRKEKVKERDTSH